MKINGADGSGGARRLERPVDSHRVRKPEASRAGNQDRVELSAEARQVAALAEASGGLPAVRQDKVDTLRRALDAGTYQVDPRRLARAILEFEDGIPDKS
ncbi:MAG: flagellar biosynthesis anti-sigma factor FlgM [Acidobacteriia bacterium]|nr:flagellar biosynthesis anti-sigma factor FlgM [Terriglobia bacterium]